ncbi:MAG: ABC transporter permease [Betaproteobacteria bacterium]
MNAPAYTPPATIIRRLDHGLYVVLSRVLAITVIVVVLALLSPQFLTWGNFSNVMRQASLQFLMAAGLTIVVLTGGIDLAIGAILGLAACLSAALMSQGHLAWGIVAALAVGLAAGGANGLLVTYGRIPAFIATYGMLWIAHGLGYVFMKGEVIYGLPESFRFIGAGFVWGIPVPVIVALALLIVLHVMLHGTVVGRAIYAIGGNPHAARLSGMPVRSRLIFVYALSGLLSGFAALVVIARVNAADSSLGEDLLLPAIATVCLGGTSLFGGTGGIVGTAIGALILALVVNGMNLLGVQTLWQSGVMGAIILVSVLADQVGGSKLMGTRS